MATINPYLTFNGNCEEAFNFYKSVFGGEFSYVGRFSEMPPMPHAPEMSEEQKNKIMHISLPVGEGTILMASDAMEGFGDVNPGTNFSISINTKSKEEADRLFNGLAEGGTITMTMNETFWGAYFGTFIDKFGIAWMVNCELKRPEQA